MTEISELEKQRLANIQRNLGLLRTLNLSREVTEREMGAAMSTASNKPKRAKRTSLAKGTTTRAADASPSRAEGDSMSESDASLRRSKRPRSVSTLGYNEVKIADQVFGTPTQSSKSVKQRTKSKSKDLINTTNRKITEHVTKKQKTSKKPEVPTKPQPTKKQNLNASSQTADQLNGSKKTPTEEFIEAYSSVKRAISGAKGISRPVPTSAHGGKGKPRLSVLESVPLEPSLNASLESFNSTYEVPKTPERQNFITKNSREASPFRDMTTCEEIESSPGTVTMEEDVKLEQDAQSNSIPFGESVVGALTSPAESQSYLSQFNQESHIDSMHMLSPFEETLSSSTPKPAHSKPRDSNLQLLRKAVTTKSVSSIASRPTAEVQLRTTSAHKKKKPVTLECMEIHPSVARKLVCVGDSRGHVSIWNSDHEELFGEDSDEAIVNRFKMHGKRSVTSICMHPQRETKLYSSGWDERIVCLDLETGSDQTTVLDLKQVQFFREPAYITHMEFGSDDPETLYFATHRGQFGRIDNRQQQKLQNPQSRLYLQLSDAPIVNFAINPAQSNQIATVSLDRTLKIWDLRYLSPYKRSNVSSENDSFSDSDSSITMMPPTTPLPLTAHLYGQYQDGGASPDLNSLLTSVSWNSKGSLLASTMDPTNADYYADDSLLIFDRPLQTAASTWTASTVFMRPFKYTSAVFMPKSPYVYPAAPRGGAGSGDYAELSWYNHHFKNTLSTKWQATPGDALQKFAVVSSNLSSIVIYGENGDALHTLDYGTQNLSMVRLHPSQSWLASVTTDNTAQMWS